MEATRTLQGSGQADLLALGAASFASSAALRLCDAMLPALAREFGVPLAAAAWTTSSYALAYGLLQLVYGTLGDRHGKWRVVSAATLACTVGNALAALSGSMAMLVFARVLSGATAAAIIPLSLAWIGDNVTMDRRQVVLARYLTATITGMIAGQWLSGLLADTVGWRWAFAGFALLFALIGSCMALRGLVERRVAPREAERHDFLSGVAAVLCLSRSRRVLAITVLHAALTFGAVTFVPAFLHQAWGLSLRAAAGVVVLYGVGGLVYAWSASALLQRIAGPRLMIAGGVLLALSWLGLAVAPHWAWALPACLLAGLGYYAMQNLLNLQATVMYPPLRGTALSLFAAALFGGIALGVSLAALAISRVGYRTVFVICAVGVLLVSASCARWLAGRDDA
jgi:YNFM family putative membrane transporter